MSRCIRLLKGNQNEMYIHIHVPYLQQNPPTPCLSPRTRFRASKVHKNIQFTPELHRSRSLPTWSPDFSISIDIKYTSPVKVALLRAQWWFLQWREGLGALGAALSAVPTRALQCPQTPGHSGVTPQRALLCPRCVRELHLTESVGFWEQRDPKMLCSARVSPSQEPFGVARSDLSPRGCLETSSQGISAGYKVVTRVPLGIWLDRDGLNSEFCSSYCSRIHPGGVKCQNLTTPNPQQKGTRFWDATLQFSFTCAKNMYFIRKGFSTLYLCF